MAAFTGSEPVTTLSDNFNFLNNQINDSGIGLTSYAVDTGTANNLIVTLASAPLAYEAGMLVCTKPAFTNTGASVINVNSLGNVPIVNPANLPLNNGEITVSSLLTLVYDGTLFRIMGPCALVANPSAYTTQFQTINCAGYNSVNVIALWTAGTGMSMALQNLQLGAHIELQVINQTGATKTVAMQNCTNATGGALGVTALQSGVGGGSGNINMVSTGLALSNGEAYFFSGCVINSATLIFRY